MSLEGFNVVEKDGLRLITPALGTTGLANGIWNKNNLWYRSRLEDLSGNIASQGWHKFGNLGSGADAFRIEIKDVLEAIERKDAVATLKYDGSALYFSSYEGKRIIRSRGGFDYSSFQNKQEISDLKTKYPIMFDPQYMEEYTLLCEFCTPSWQIVIKYPEPFLVLLGAIHNKTLKYLTINELAQVSVMTGVRLVDNFILNSKGWAELQERLEKEQDIEGYVIRINGEQSLVKIKCLPYLTKHAIKSNITISSLVDRWFETGCLNYVDFCQKFISDFDEETCIWAQPIITTVFEGVNKYKKTIQELQEKVNLTKGCSRKEFAMAAHQEYGASERFAISMSLFLGTEPERKILKRLLVANIPHVDFKNLNNK